MKAKPITVGVTTVVVVVPSLLWFGMQLAVLIRPDAIDGEVLWPEGRFRTKRGAATAEDCDQDATNDYWEIFHGISERVTIARGLPGSRPGAGSLRAPGPEPSYREVRKPGE
jgi:hypothetical protein